LQGQYGYALDNLVSARVVTASGKLVQTSRSKNPDLFWALQGAGHNFGVLTSLEVKTYDIPSNWTVYSIVFSSEKLEALFFLVNELESSSRRPAKLALTGVFVRIPAVDPLNVSRIALSRSIRTYEKQPVVAYTVAYEGSEADAEPYAAQFKALGPLSVTVSNVDYVELYTATGNSLASQPCVRNNNLNGAGTSLPAWDLQGVRTAFSIFANLSADSRFTKSITLMENYGMKGVRAVNPSSTALALEEREYPILASAIIWFEGDDEQTAKEAAVYVEAVRDALYMGVDKSNKKRHCYVNYANGGEKQPELYGYDWRLDKLTNLKKKWDPENRFGFYNPIV
jgi:hypothetical protein